jgi:hypothetical protein
VVLAARADAPVGAISFWRGMKLQVPFSFAQGRLSASCVHRSVERTSVGNGNSIFMEDLQGIGCKAKKTQRAAFLRGNLRDAFVRCG